MKRFSSFIYVTSCLCLFVAVGVATRYFTITHFHDESSSYRNPASIPPVFESQVDLSKQEEVAQRKILAGARTILEAGKIGVTIGHFTTLDADGKSMMACDLYDRVYMTFSAEGVATSGERPSIVVEGPCEVGKDATRIDPLWVPVDAIKSKPPVNGSFQVTDPKPITIKFEHMIDSWPTMWSLTEVKLYNHETQKTLIIDSVTIYKMSSIRLSMVW